MNNNNLDLAIEMSGVVTTLQGELKFVRIGVCTNPEKKYHNDTCGIMFNRLGLNKNDKMYLITSIRIRDEFKDKDYDAEILNQFIIDHHEFTILKENDTGDISLVHSNK